MTSDDDTCWGGRKWKFASDAQKLWLERMAERGWTVQGDGGNCPITLQKN